MRSTLDELVTELAELRAFVASFEPVNDVLKTHIKTHKDSAVQKYISIRRRFDYAAFSVALYASFEKFVENLLAAYVRLEAGRVPYASLPKRLIDKHLTGTAELLWRRRLGSGRYVGVSDLSAVGNLFDCLSGKIPYSLNEAVLTAHDANLRASELDAIFGSVGIEQVCDRACSADAMIEWYCGLQGLETLTDNRVARTVIEERLKDIVDRRNEVAHRGARDSEILAGPVMTEAIGFTMSLSVSLFGLVVARYLESHHNAPGTGGVLALRRKDGPYKRGRVVVVEKPAFRLYVGQPVFVLLESTGARWGRIQRLRISDMDVPDIDPSAIADEGIGIELDFRYPKSGPAKLVALRSDDDVVWSTIPSVHTTDLA